MGLRVVAGQALSEQSSHIVVHVSKGGHGQGHRDKEEGKGVELHWNGAKEESFGQSLANVEFGCEFVVCEDRFGTGAMRSVLLRKRSPCIYTVQYSTVRAVHDGWYSI